MTEPFFSRWSKRKQAQAQGLPVAEPEQTTPTPAKPAPAKLTQTSVVSLSKNPDGPSDLVHTHAQAPETPQPPSPELPSLDDAQALTPKSDFRPFMQQGVASDVRNAAVKKLFTDPHFNVMDGLDIYIGDYNTPDPLPAGMLEKMVGAQLLNLFEPKDPPELQGAPLVAQSPALSMTPELQATPALQAPEPTQHDHPDLQLQPNHAPASQSTGPSTG